MGGMKQRLNDPEHNPRVEERLANHEKIFAALFRERNRLNEILHALIPRVSALEEKLAALQPENAVTTKPTETKPTETKPAETKPPTYMPMPNRHTQPVEAKRNPTPQLDAVEEVPPEAA